MQKKKIRRNFSILFMSVFLCIFLLKHWYEPKRPIAPVRDVPSVEIPVAPAAFRQEIFHKNQISVMGWNVENLFDTENNPLTEDEEFTPQGKSHWNHAALRKKLYNLSDVIRRVNGARGPDIIGLCEVENEKVLQQLADHPNLIPLKYEYCYYKKGHDPRGIDVALMSRYPASQVEGKIPYPGGRNILVGKFQIRNHALYVLVNHWRSRLGGKVQTQERRIQSALKCVQIIQEIQKKDLDADIILLGDFNDNPQDASIRRYLKAVPYQGKMMKNVLLYNLTNTAYITGEARPAYHFDQIIISRGLLDKKGFYYLKNTCEIIAYPFMLNKEGGSLSFSSFDGQGYSDHFPVVVKLGMAQ